MQTGYKLNRLIYIFNIIIIIPTKTSFFIFQTAIVKVI